ncbi:MAG TPA: metal-sulfur cluster assembly factor [Methylomirabilota bacterium]
MSVTREQITEALRDVFDPELGMSVVDLGLIYDLAIDGGRIDVTMTLTTQGCPLHDAMTEWVRQAIARIPGVQQVEVSIVFDPPWTPDRIRQDALP